jgi:hypothetical protein
MIALAQTVLAGQTNGDVGILLARQVPVDPQEAVALVSHVEVSLDLDRLVALRLTVVFDLLDVIALWTVLATTVLPAAATTTAASATFALLLVAALAVAALLVLASLLLTALLAPALAAARGGAAAVV